MLSYYISASNETAVRVKDKLSSGSLSLTLENMTTYATSSISLATGSYSFYSAEQMLRFDIPTISGSRDGDQYVVRLLDTTGSVSTQLWKGTMQIFDEQNASYFASGSNKFDYITLNDTAYSYLSDNDYIIL